MTPDRTRLNVGTGENYAEGWCNCDIHSLPHWKKPPDVMCSIYDLSQEFEAHSVSQIFLSHILEHLDYGQIPQAIEECFKVLKSDGRIAIVGPCIELAIQTEQPYWLLQNIIKHDEDKPGLGHAWTPTAEMTLRAVADGCFRSLHDPKLIPVNTIRPPEWPNPEPDAMWQMAILVERIGG